MRLFLFAAACFSAINSMAQASLTLEYPAPYFWSEEPVRFAHLDKTSIPLWFTAQYVHHNHGLAVSHDWTAIIYEVDETSLPATYLRRYEQVSVDYRYSVVRQGRWSILPSVGVVRRYYSEQEVFLHKPSPWEVITESTGARRAWGFNGGLTVRYRICQGITAQLAVAHNYFPQNPVMQKVTVIKPGLGYTFGWQRKGFR